ncbi:MAG: alpha/beta hydrolase [Gammaproteobacteria bacterium]
MTILLIYCLLLLAVFLLQRKMLYFPSRFSQEQQANLTTELKLQAWPSADNQRGFIGKPSPVDAKGTVLVFHGNAGSAIHRRYLIDGLQAQGYRVIIAEYPGYGIRDGTPSEAKLIEDGIAVAKLALKQFHHPLFLCGESLGTGVVAGIVASRQVKVKGLLLITPFDSMANVAQHHYWFFLARWLLLDRYDNVARLRDFAGAVAVLIAERDEIIPNQYTLALFDKLSGPKKLWHFTHAGHNTLPMSPQEPWWHEVMAFIDR